MGWAADPADHNGSTVNRRTPNVPDSLPAAVTVRKCFMFQPSGRPTASQLADALKDEDRTPGRTPSDLSRENEQLKLENQQLRASLRHENRGQVDVVAERQGQQEHGDRPSSDSYEGFTHGT